jgi:hypothetical protein
VVEKRSAQGALAFEGRKIPLTIEFDDRTVEQALSFAATIASTLAAYDQISKDTLERDLRHSYNSGWNEYDQAQEDCSFKSVVHPALNPAEFKARFALNGVDTTGDSCVSLWYECGNLFWGHGVFVESLDGPDFTNAKAQLFG